MKNQKGMSLISLVIALALLLSISMVTVQAVSSSNDIINKAEETKINIAHGEINEQLELNHQTYYIEKLTGEYNGDLIDYLRDKGFINENGIVNMSLLLGKRENKVITGKGNDYKDIYKVESTANKDVKIVYYDQNGTPSQIGNLVDTV